MLCPGIELNRGQKKMLSGKLSAKDFVYSALPMIWSREVLCTHSVTGRRSNAHKEREAKPQLDAEKVDSLSSKYRNIPIIIHLSLWFTCSVPFYYQNSPRNFMDFAIFTLHIIFKNRQTRLKKLDSLKILIVFISIFLDYVAQKFGITQKEVRNLMTTKINNIIKCCKQQKVAEQKNE